MKNIILLLICVIPFGSFAKVRNGMPRMSFSEVEDSTLSTPEVVFDEYNNDLKEYDMGITMPKGFRPISFISPEAKMGIRFFVHSDCFPDVPNTFYSLGLESDNGDVMMLYPTLCFDFGNQTIRQGREIESELRAVHKDCELDVNPHVDIYDVRKMKGFANADTIAFYEFTTDAFLSPNIDTSRFNHCIGIYLRSKNHPALLLKILLNDESYSRKDDYIKLLLDNVKYGNTNTRLSPIEAQLTNHYTDLCFPTVLQRHSKTSVEGSATKPVMDQLPDSYIGK